MPLVNKVETTKRVPISFNPPIVKFTSTQRIDCCVSREGWLVAASIMAVLASLAGTAQAATQYATGGFIWNDGITAKWGPNGGPYTSVWNAGNDAVFQGSAGTVSIAATGATAHNITFTTTGFKISGNTLTLNAATPTISTGTGITATINSVIAGSAGLTKSGVGTLNLGGNNTYSGTLAIDSGIVSASSLADSGAGSNGTGAIRIGSGTNTSELIYTGSGATLTRQINLAGSSGGAKITNNGAGALDFTNANFFSAVASGAKTLTLQGSNGGTISGAIDNGGGNVRLTKAGAGTWTLTGSNTYTGATTINDGTLEIGDGNLTGSLSASSSITNNSILAFNRSNTLTQGTDFNSTITGTGGVIQKGSGTTIFTGSNDYAGTTTVSAGTLRVNGSIDGAGEVNVESGAILSGTGYIAGAVNVSGTLAPGDGSGGIGTLSFGQTLNLSDIANFKIDPNLALGLNADLANVTGDISYGGILNVIELHTTFADGMQFKLFEAATYNGSFTTVNLPTLTAGLYWQDELTTNGMLTVIPEPRAALLGTLGMLMLLRRRRA